MSKDAVMEQLCKLMELQGLTQQELDALITTWSVLQHLNSDTFDDCNNTRVCTQCGITMLSGYCIHDGEEYYCSDSCLNKNYTVDEYLEMYDDGEGDSYWTEWS